MNRKWFTIEAPSKADLVGVGLVVVTAIIWLTPFPCGWIFR